MLMIPFYFKGFFKMSDLKRLLKSCYDMRHSEMAQNFSTIRSQMRHVCSLLFVNIGGLPYAQENNQPLE